MLYLISYDIPDDTRRFHVAETLKDFGRRVQYSVFEALLDQGLLDQMRTRLTRLVHTAEDSVRIYRLCGECEKLIEILGTGQRTVEEKIYIV